MADNLGYKPGSGAVIAADEIDEVYYQRVKPVIGPDGTAVDLEPGQQPMAGSIPVAIASDQSAVSVSGTVTANTGLDQPLTDTQLRATDVTVTLGGERVRIEALDPDTDTYFELRGSPDAGLDVDTGLTQPLTDTELRATPVPVSGTVTAETGLDQPLTDTQLRETAVPVSGTVGVGSLPASASYNRTSTLNSESGTHVGAADPGTPLFVGEWEDCSDAGQVMSSAFVQDSSSYEFRFEWSNNQNNVLYGAGPDQHYTWLGDGALCAVVVRARYVRVSYFCTIVDEGSGDHPYVIDTIFNRSPILPVTIEPGSGAMHVMAASTFDVAPVSGATIGAAASAPNRDPTLSTSAYADGDVLFATMYLNDWATGSEIVSVSVLDRDNNAGAFDLIFINDYKGIGTVNDPVSMDEAKDYVTGVVSITAGDYIVIGDVAIATKTNIGLVPTASTCYIAGVSRDTKTYTANGIKIWLGTK